MSNQHSVLAPSSAHRRLRCAASLAVSKDIPNLPSQYSAEGTAYHQIAAEVLEAGGNECSGYPAECSSYVGLSAHVLKDGSCIIGDMPKPGNVEFTFVIDEENAAHAQTYVDAIRRIPGQKFIEVRLDTSEIVGVPGQGGTADCVTLDYDNNTLHLDDLKFGRGEQVDAIDNEQLLEYGAAALKKFEFNHDWHFLKIAIHQPRLNHYSEQVWHVDKVWEWVEKIRPLEYLAYRLWEDPSQVKEHHFTPSEKGCRWCPIRRTCHARTKQVLDQFPLTPPAGVAVHLSLTELAEARNRVDAIEAWCKDIKEEAHMRAMRGDKLVGWKLVEGRKGNRKWAEPEKAEQSLLFPCLGEDAYKPREIISPAEAEKAFKKAKRDFSSAAPFITQAPASLSLERDDSPKPAVSAKSVEFPLQEPSASV